MLRSTVLIHGWTIVMSRVDEEEIVGFALGHTRRGGARDG